MDYRRLNAQTIKDVYPTPRVEDAISDMKGARYFANMDLRYGFYQIRVAPEDVHKTAFQTEWSSFQWLVMPFGLINASSTFQRNMDMIFDDMRLFTSVYTDDIVVYSKRWTDHLENVKAVLQRLRDSKFFVKRSKCEFATEEIDVVGFRVSARVVPTQPENWKPYSNGPSTRIWRTFEVSQASPISTRSSYQTMRI